ncbi:MAG: glycosyltransferase [Arcobacter sp.]|nr:glycosyltransferase [Arcobacter sp.]
MIKRKDFLVIADCHNKALRRSVNNPFSFIYEGIKKWTFRQTDITIITNKGMIPDIEKYHKNYFILPDKIPNFEVLKETKKKEKYCVFISSFAVDEPVDEIISVARNIGNDVKIYWTGKKNRNINLPKDIPTNIIFTGYLSNHDYYKLLSNADCILILTTEDNCLQCGAYEGLNANVPMVISDNKASRDYFEEAALYTKIDSQKISETIFDSLQMTSEEASLKSKIVRLKREAEFIDLIDNLILEIKSKLKL